MLRSIRQTSIFQSPLYEPKPTKLIQAIKVMLLQENKERKEKATQLFDASSEPSLLYIWIVYQLLHHQSSHHGYVELKLIVSDLIVWQFSNIYRIIYLICLQRNYGFFRLVPQIFHNVILVPRIFKSARVPEITLVMLNQFLFRISTKSQVG